MLRLLPLALSFALVLLRGCSETPPPQLNASLQEALLSMRDADQDIRTYVAQKVPNGGAIDSIDVARWDSIDTANTRRLKQIIDEFGWPGHSLVGEEGAAAAFLLAQHADKEPAFQKRALALLAEAVEAEDASPQHLAYLTDRVRVSENEPQVYGTQMNWVDSEPVPYPLEDSVNVDKRRALVGLGPLSEYIEQMKK